MRSSNQLEKVQKNCPKKFIGQKLLYTIIKVKTQFFCHFFVVNLFRMTFVQFFSMDLRSALNSAFFDAQYCIFVRIFYYFILGLFTNFEGKQG
jgi:hypothetical protein